MGRARYPISIILENFSEVVATAVAVIAPDTAVGKGLVDNGARMLTSLDAGAKTLVRVRIAEITTYR